MEIITWDCLQLKVKKHMLPGLKFIKYVTGHDDVFYTQDYIWRLPIQNYTANTLPNCLHEVNCRDLRRTAMKVFSFH